MHAYATRGLGFQPAACRPRQTTEWRLAPLIIGLVIINFIYKSFENPGSATAHKTYSDESHFYIDSSYNTHLSTVVEIS